MKPIDKAIYYIEYVLKNDGGVPKLRSGALNLTFWERHLVDVALCIVGICLLPILGIAVLIQIVLRKSHQRRMAGSGDKKNGSEKKGSIKTKTS